LHKKQDASSLAILFFMQKTIQREAMDGI
jgi:hypothetical protein